MATQYTQDSTPTNPFGVGYRQQAVDRSKRLVDERRALGEQLDEQLNTGPYAFSNVRNANNELQALKADPNADPAAVTAAQAKYDELRAGRSELSAQKEQNLVLLRETETGLRENQVLLAEAETKAVSTPPNTQIVNAGNDPAANSTPPVVSDSNITGAVPPAQPLNVNTPDSITATPPTAEDPGLEEARLAAEARFNQEPAEFSAADVTPTDEEALALLQQQEENRKILAAQATEVEPSGSGYSATSAIGGIPYDDEGNLNPGWTLDENNNPVYVGGDFVEPATANQANADRTAAQVGQKLAQDQAARRAAQNVPSQADWRVRLSLADGSNYLYNFGDKDSAAGILAPLRATNGVIFPYTPTIDTTYHAKYNPYDLVHSNYRGYFYQNSYVDQITIKGTFTAQDTREAQYLLAVIHFFRSATKMFYGAKDEYAGTPPPMVFLSGLGQYQFNKHPCLISNFTYALPNDVDYIRADGFNNYNINLDNRRSLSTGAAPGGILAGSFSLASKLGINKLFAGGIQTPPALSTVNKQVNQSKIQNSTYVPTKMEITVQLYPTQTRQQVSQQFSMKEFANGSLLTKGFW